MHSFDFRSLISCAWGGARRWCPHKAGLCFKNDSILNIFRQHNIFIKYPQVDLCLYSFVLGQQSMK